MEIKVGQKWKSKLGGMCITIKLIEKTQSGRIYINYLGDMRRPMKHDYFVMSDDELLNNYKLIESFRPHWLLDDGTKIYADSVNIDNDDIYRLSEVVYENANFIWYTPSQYKHKESDFGILLADGSHMWARWMGEEND